MAKKKLLIEVSLWRAPTGGHQPEVRQREEHLSRPSFRAASVVVAQASSHLMRGTFASLVDDTSAHPDRFPTREAKKRRTNVCSLII